jgi:peptidoglycan-associated lipoprotein
MVGAQTIIFLSVTMIACGGKAKTPAKPPSAPATAVPGPPAAAKPAVAASPNVAVSDDLARQCNLRFAGAEQAPKFGFDAAELTPEDRDILQQVAQCLVKGPLEGRSVQLVGRADPRGTDEYNLGLGTRRAESVRQYLQRLGVPATRLAPTTRGDLDASGVDETSWQRDRRVDLKLAN